MEKIIKLLNKVSSEVASWVVFFMMAVAVIDVVGRYVFKSSLVGSQDLTQLMMVLVVYFGLGCEAEDDGNVRIEIFYNHFSNKKKAIANIISYVLGLAMYLTVAYKLLSRSLSVFARNNAKTMTLGISLAPFLMIAAIGCFILSLQLVANIIENIRVLRTKETHTDRIAEGGTKE